MEDKKERILTIAQKIFSRFGIQKTTMDEIAKKARIGKATLYYYFKNKEDIFREVIQKESTILKENIELKEELTNLTKQLNIKENENEDIINNYESLKMAKTIAVSSGDAHDAKIKINRLVREIDKCISLLNK